MGASKMPVIETVNPFDERMIRISQETYGEIVHGHVLYSETSENHSLIVTDINLIPTDLDVDGVNDAVLRDKVPEPGKGWALWKCGARLSYVLGGGNQGVLSRFQVVGA